jgi:carbamoyl-phosphate synthase large subunit
LFVNNNPDALTTDFRYTDRLYFEPVCSEDVADILNKEKPQAVLFQFAGEKASEMARLMKSKHVRVLGADSDVFDLLNRHEQLCECLIAVGVNYSRESFLNAVRLEMDVISDGEDGFIPGISEHIERSGIHAGDSISVCPPVSLNSADLE